MDAVWIIFVCAFALCVLITVIKQVCLRMTRAKLMQESLPFTVYATIRNADEAEYIVRSALAEGRLARLNVPDCTVMMHRQLFYHRDKWVTPQMNVFIELVRQGAQIK